MKIGISQPTFLPWQGYFALIDYVDVFVFLDSVQFVKRSWIQRNKIKNNDKEQWITIPVKSKNKRFQAIKDTKIDFDHLDKKKIVNSIYNNYKKSKNFEIYFEVINKIILECDENISNLNETFIKKFSNSLGLKTKFIKSSELPGCDDFKNIELLKHICLNLSAKEYVSTIGSKAYMGKKNFFENTDVEIKFFEYKPSAYDQLGKIFVPYLSIIDLLFNEGSNSGKILKKNFILL
jgi:hypothetical protein